MRQLLVEKTNYKNSLSNLRDEYLLKIYQGFIHKKTPKQIAKELYDLTINSKVKNIDSLDYASKIIIRIAKRMPSKEALIQVCANKYPRYIDDIKFEEDALALMCFGFMDSMGAYQDLRKIDNKSANKMEEVKKKAMMDGFYKSSRKQHQIFYISSKHKDCAEDHLEAQGKVYIDENWQSYVEEEYKKEVADYIQVHHIQSIQHITDKPVWLITRPNCRHYFKALNTEEVLSTSVNTMLKKHNMSRVIGDRQYLQTYKQTSDETRKLMGEYRNAQLMVDKYKDRLRFHQKLYKAKKIPLIKEAIVKDKFLIKKWQDYMQRVK